MKPLFILIIVSCVVFTSAQAADVSADKKNVDTACVQESQTANCEGKKVGSGLLKCLHAYKKANPTFQFSATCLASMMTLRTDVKATLNPPK